jgi:hypothetical protein
MPTSASPVYWLLSNPSWIGERDERDQKIVESLQHGWDYDPNEAHDGVSLLVGFLLAQTSYSYSGSADEATTFQVVKALLGRGANAQEAMQEQAKRPGYNAVRWDTIPSVRSLLLSWQHDRKEISDSLSVGLIAILRNHHDAGGAEEKIEQLLGESQGWNTLVQGIPVSSWIAINAMGYGMRLPGWTEGTQSTGGMLAARVRMCRTLVQRGQMAESNLKPHERLMAACGLVALAATCSSTMDDISAQSNAYKTARKLVADQDIESALGEIVKSGLNEDIKARIGANFVRAAEQLCETPDEAWRCIAKAWPLLQSENITSKDAFASRSANFIQSPPDSFFEEMAPTERNRDLLLHMVLGGALYTNTFSTQPVEQYLAWHKTHSHALPKLDVDQMLGLGGSALRGNATFMATLDAAAIDMDTHAIPQPRTSRARL